MSEDLVPQGQAQSNLASVLEPMSGLDLMTLATVFVKSGYFPDVKSVAQGVVKILAGRELGFGPVASLRHIYVRDGHIGLMATLAATRIRQSKVYDYKVLKADGERCEIEFRRKTDEGKWESLGVSSFTVEQAKQAGVWREGSGWTKWTEDMLFARAMMRGQRRYCPDVFGQTVYDVSELGEIAAANAERMAGKPDAKVTEVTPVDDNPMMPKAKSKRETPTPEVTDAEVVPIPPKAEASPHAEPTQDQTGLFTEIPKPSLPKATYLQLATLAEQVDAKLKPAKDAKMTVSQAMLQREFKIKKIEDLSEEDAERFAIRLKEILEN